MDEHTNLTFGMNEEMDETKHGLHELVDSIHAGLDTFQNNYRLNTSVVLGGNNELTGRGLGSNNPELAATALSNLDYLNLNTEKSGVNAGYDAMEQVHAGSMHMHNKIDHNLKNLHTHVNDLNEFKKIVDSNFKEIINQLSTDEKTLLTTKLIKVQKLTLDEIDNQINHITKIVSKLEPVQIDVTEFIKNNSQFFDIIKKLGFEVGHKDAVNSLSIVYSDINNMEKLVSDVKKSLAALNLSEKEYLENNNATKISEKLTKVFDILMKDKNIKPDKLKDIFEAISILKTSINKHKSISEYLHKPKSGGLESAEHLPDRLADRLQTHKKSITNIINQFITAFSKNVDSTISNIDKMAKSIGHNVKYSDDLINFINAYKSLAEFNTATNLYQSLLEINGDEINNVEIKNRFIQDIKLLIQRVESLNKVNSASILSTIQSNFLDILKTIDNYSDAMKLTKQEIKKGGAVSLSELFSTMNSAIDIVVLSNTINDIKTSIKKLDFYSKIATMKSNLKYTSKELESVSKDYTTLVAKTIGETITKIQNETIDAINQINDNSKGLGLEIDVYNNSAEDVEKISKESLKSVYQLRSDARTGLYKTIEAIEFYLLSFTDSLIKNPDVLGDLNKLLNTTKIIAKYFTNKSGDNLIKIFESFGSNKDLVDQATFITDYDALPTVSVLDQIIPSTQSKIIYEKCKIAVDGVVILKNILEYFISIGNNSFHKQESKNNFLSPNIIYKNLVTYIYVSALSMGITSYERLDDNDKITRTINIDDTKVKLAQCSASNPTEIGFSANTKISMIKLKLLKAQQDIVNFRTYVISLNSTDEVAKARLLAMSIYNKIKKESLLLSVFNTYFTVESNEVRLNSASPNFDNVTRGIDNQLGGIDYFNMCIYRMVVGMMNILNMLNNQNDLFKLDDVYFVLTLKAIAGKVFTVAGVNSIMKHPGVIQSSIINPSRLILGGSMLSPDIVNDAVELYCRLPLMVEFYRDIFDFGNKTFKNDGPLIDSDNELISFVPELGSVWNGLISVIFDKSKYIDNGIYTENDIKKIINEVNNIYKYYSSQKKDDLTRYIVNQLIGEVNRRYGIIKRQELQDYYKVSNSINNSSYSNINERVDPLIDLDILDEVNDYEYASPSDAYIKIKSNTSLTVKEKLSQLTDYKILTDFRAKFDNVLKSTNIASVTTFSLNEKIRLYKMKISKLTSNEEKYKLIAHMIEQTENVNQTDQIVYIAYHELVLTPLNVLYGTWRSINHFIKSYYKTFYFKLVSSLEDDSRFSNTVKDNITNLIVEDMPIGSDTGTYLGSLVNNYGNELNILEVLNNFTNSNNGLVHLTMNTNGRFTLDVSKLQQHCEALLNNAKYMITKFNGVIDKSIITDCENPSSVGSIYWLENNLINITFNKLNKKIDTWADSAKSFDLLLLTLPTILTDKKLEIYNRSVANNFSRLDTISSLDVNKFIITGSSLIASSQIEWGTNNCLSIIKDTFKSYDGKDWVTSTPNPTGRLGFTNLLLNPFNTPSNKQYGLLGSFNNTIMQYLNQLYDPMSKKIYGKLFQSFTNETFAEAIYGKGANDVFVRANAPIAGAVNYIESRYKIEDFLPYTGIPLSNTICFTLRTLLNRTIDKHNNNKFHLHTNLLEVAGYMLEKYRVKLPVFVKMLELLINKLIYYRHILDKLNVTHISGVNIDNTTKTAFSGTYIIDNKQEYMLWNDSVADTSIPPNSNVKSNYISMIDNMVDGTRSLINDAKSVLEELNVLDASSPVYFDTKKDFTKNFHANTHKTPFAPFSLLTTLLNPTILSNDLLLAPSENSNNNKFMYGSRLVLLNDQSVTNKQLTFMNELLTTYNGYNNVSNSIDLNKFNEYLDCNSKLLKFNAEYNYFNFEFNTNTQLFNNTRSVQTLPSKLQTYSVANNIIASLSLVENTNVVDAANNIYKLLVNNFLPPTSTVPTINGNNVRTTARLVNIIDLNVMPLNIHAMMREIPLINIYNYAFTYESIVDNKINNINEVIQFFLKNPHEPVILEELPVNASATDYSDRVVVQIDAGVYRPISDIYNKTIDNKEQGQRFIKEHLFHRLLKLDNAPASSPGIDGINSRFNTKLFRNLLFMYNIQSVIKYKVKTELEFINSKVVSNMAVVSDLITDASVKEDEFEF